LDIHFILQKVAAKSLIVQHIPSLDKIEPLSGFKFLEFGDNFKMFDQIHPT